MINKKTHVSRKIVKEDRIAICPHFGCSHIEKIKPLKVGLLGFRKYPKCSTHKVPLVFVDEFIENFFNAANACIFDVSSLPSEDLISLIKMYAPEELKAFIYGWMYCTPIGRGVQIVSNYMDGLSRGYMKLLSRKQRKELQNQKHSKNRYLMLRSGLEKIAGEYSTFLQGLRIKSEVYYDPRELHPLSDKVTKLLKKWLKSHLKEIHLTNPKYKNELIIEKESFKIIKLEYDKILDAGTCSLLIGKSPTIVTKGFSPFELFSLYHEFFNAGLCRELKKNDFKLFLKRININEEPNEKYYENGTQTNLFFKPAQKKISEKRVGYNKEHVNSSTNEFVNSEIEQNLTQYNLASFQPKSTNYKQRVKNKIIEILSLIKATEKQRELILNKAEDVLNRHILRAKIKSIIIHKDVNPLRHAGAIIYAVLVSNKNMPQISSRELSMMIGAPYHVVYNLYNLWYKDLVRKVEFDFGSQKLGNIRKIISLFIFELLFDPNQDFNKIILHLEEINTSKIVLSLKEIIINQNNNHKLISQFSDREKIVIQNMATNYPEVFEKFFFDIIEIVKLLMISIKSHNIITADFSILPFTRYLITNDIDLYLKEDRLREVIEEIFYFLKSKKKYSKFFPNQSRTSSVIEKVDATRMDIIGNKIKLYAMKHLYNGIYYYNGIANCPDCLEEGLIINTSNPRIRSKEFHHEEEKNQEYTAFYLHQLFSNDRGNPFFLRDLIKKMESESVVLKCGVHHSLLEANIFNNFKKLIIWENIPDEFPQSIFDLPPEIIHLLIRVCVDNSFLTKANNNSQKKSKRRRIKILLKKRYIIDSLYSGFCPACGEFNTHDHLVSFDFNHLYELKELNLEDRRIRTDDIRGLFRSLSCSEIVKELQRQIGGYICRNCHFVIHDDISKVSRIYDDQNTIKKVLKDHKDTMEKFKQNLIRSNKLIKNPLKSDMPNTQTYLNFLIALFEISKSSQDGVTRKDLLNYLGIKTYDNIFEKRAISKKYLEIVVGERRQIRYYINNEGKKIVRLIYYFRDYYRKLSY